MLTVAKVTAKLAAGYADYLEGKTTASELGDYYLRGGERVEAPGRWVGVPAGDGQTVSGRELRELLAVRDPRTGRPLRPAGASGEAVAALDATFSAPKSVSAAWALGDPELRGAIEQAHEDAIDRALGYAVERVAMVRRRVDRETVLHVMAAGVVATSWRHTTARAVDGFTPDPQLHSHVLLHAAVRGDGKLAAIDSRAWLLARRELGAAYRTELARELAGLGFEIERGTGRGGRYFEIVGIPRALLDRWSSRHRQVRAAIDARLADREGAVKLTPAQERLAAVTSRTAKQPMRTVDLDRRWRRDGEQAGLDTHAVGSLRDQAPRQLPAVEAPELISALTEFDATFADRDARAVALERSAGAPVTDALAALEHARAGRQLLRLADGRNTTASHRRIELEVVATAASLAKASGERVDPAVVMDSAETIDSRLVGDGGGLSVEQRRALVLATGERRVVMIEGQAGTGKSTVLQAVALAHQAEGRQVIVTSTAALAAQRLARDLAESGVDAPAYSTAALHHAIQTGNVRLDSSTTVIHDEAALAASREQHQLLRVVEESGARLVLVGDAQQSKPVGAGGLWPELERQLHDHDARLELTHNLRARDPADRRDQARFREGKHVEAILGYAERGRVRIAPGSAGAQDAALLAAHEDRRSGRHALVIAQTSNERLDELNARAQALRVLDGELGPEGIPVVGRPYQLHGGDEIQIRHSIKHPDRGLLRNGTNATVIDVDTDRGIASLRLADGAEVQLDQRQLEQAEIRLAYVQHPVPAQGATSDTAHLILSEHATREGSYVALTRARQQTHIHASWEQLAADEEQQPYEELATLLSTSEPDLPSIATPLADEQALEAEQDIETPTTAPAPNQRRWIPLIEPEREIERDNDLGWEP